MVRKATVIATIATLQAIAIPGAALSQEAPPQFEFRGIAAGAVIDRQKAGFARGECGEWRGGIQCKRADDRIAAVHAISIHQFYADRLGWMSFQFRNSATATVLLALGKRYGKPCKSEKKDWRNKAGAVFPNHVVTWCFATGDLILSERGSDRDYADLTFTDRQVMSELAPKAEARVDF